MSAQGVPIIDQHITLCFDQDLTQAEIAAHPLIWRKHSDELKVSLAATLQARALQRFC